MTHLLLLVVVPSPIRAATVVRAPTQWQCDGAQVELAAPPPARSGAGLYPAPDPARCTPSCVPRFTDSLAACCWSLPDCEMAICRLCVLEHERRHSMRPHVVTDMSVASASQASPAESTAASAAASTAASTAAIAAAIAAVSEGASASGHKVNRMPESELRQPAAAVCNVYHVDVSDDETPKEDAAVMGGFSMGSGAGVAGAVVCGLAGGRGGSTRENVMQDPPPQEIPVLFRLGPAWPRQIPEHIRQDPQFMTVLRQRVQDLRRSDVSTISIFELLRPVGTVVRWARVDGNVTRGQRSIQHEMLAEELSHGQVFSAKRWKEIGATDVRYGDIVQSGDLYFSPVTLADHRRRYTASYDRSVHRYVENAVVPK